MVVNVTLGRILSALGGEIYTFFVVKPLQAKLTAYTELKCISVNR